MEFSSNPVELFKALSSFQKEVTAAKKTSDNPFHHSKYADLAEVWDTIREPLTKNGLSVIQIPEFGEGVMTIVTEEKNSKEPEKSKVTTMTQAQLLITTVVAHVSGAFIKSTLAITPIKGDPQAVGSAITYGRRYSLTAVLGIAQDDDDGNAASGKTAPPANAPAPPPPAPPSAPKSDKAPATKPAAKTPPPPPPAPPAPPVGQQPPAPPQTPQLPSIPPANNANAAPPTLPPVPPAAPPPPPVSNNRPVGAPPPPPPPPPPAAPAPSGQKKATPEMEADMKLMFSFFTGTPYLKDNSKTICGKILGIEPEKISSDNFTHDDVKKCLAVLPKLEKYIKENGQPQMPADMFVEMIGIPVPF